VVRAVDRKDWDDETYQQWARERLAAHAPETAEADRERLIDCLHFSRGDVTDAAQLGTALDQVPGVPIVYLALPNTIFRPTLEALTEAGLPEGAQVVVEKPFGRDQADARALNQLLHRLVPETAVFRIDHFLARQTALNILGLRFANRMFEPIWNTGHVERVEIVYDETLGLEGRAGYYDTAGALRDVLQNHLLQLLALVAMEPPYAFDDVTLPAHKADVLRAVRPPADMTRDTVRGRYTAGTIGDRSLPDYVNEEGVDPSRGTETYAEFTITIDNWRWAGVPFRLRTGKALGTGRREVAVHLKPVPHLPFGDERPSPDVLRLRLDPDDGIDLELNLNGAGDPFDLERQVLAVDLPRQGLPALRSQSERLLDVVEIQAELHPQDLARLQAIARDPTDPADHSGRPAR
jgi:glucose-6-phosphate 1-dehydrogenase